MFLFKCLTFIILTKCYYRDQNEIPITSINYDGFIKTEDKEFNHNYGKIENVDIKTELNYSISTEEKDTLVYNCNFCCFSESQKSLFDLHMQVHSKEQQYHLYREAYHIEHKCRLCNFSAADSKLLIKHIDSAHSSFKLYKCEMCDYSSNYKQSITSHFNSCHLEMNRIKRFKCDFCDYASNRKYVLKQHVDTIHLNLKPHKCQLCDYAHSSKSNLKSHIQNNHLQNNLGKCHLCNYGPTVKSRLRLHINAVHKKSTI